MNKPTEIETGEKPGQSTPTDQPISATLVASPVANNVLVTIAAAIIVIAGLRGFSTTIGPIILGLVIVIVTYPVQRVLLDRGLPRWIAFVALLVAAYGTLIAMTLTLVWAGISLIQLITSGRYEEEFIQAEDWLTSQIQRFDPDGLGIGETFQNLIDQIDIGTAATQITDAVLRVFGLASSISLLVICMLFMIMDAAPFSETLNATRSARPSVVDGLHNFASRTRKYFVVSTIFGLIVAAIDTVVLMLLGIPNALVWGVVALVTNYIPNIGFVLGLIPPVAIAVFEGGWTLALWVIIIYAAINIVIQSIIQPKFVGDAVGLSTTITFLSLIFWGWVLGALGALLAVPISLLAKALLIDIHPATNWASGLISLEGPRDTAPPIIEAAIVEKADDTEPAETRESDIPDSADKD